MLVPITFPEFHSLTFSKIHDRPLPTNHKVISMNSLNIPNYGEILPSVMNEIIQIIPIDSSDVYYELGSGRGRTVFQWFFQTTVKKAIGIEIDSCRVNIALNSMDGFRKLRRNVVSSMLKDKSRGIQFVCDDFTRYDMSDATIVYTCSWCKSWQVGPLNTKTEEKLNAAPNLRFVIALHNMKGLKGFSVWKTFERKSTNEWGSDADVVYVLKRD